MKREELIAHLEHLAEYVKYSEDAPALREVIEMLKCSEMPNSSRDFFWKNARKNARKYTETHARDLIERETARRIIDSPRSKEQMLRMLEATPPAQPDHSADVSKMVNGDVVSRREAIDAINHIFPVDTEYDCTLLDRVDVICVLSDLPSAQPEPISEAYAKAVMTWLVQYQIKCAELQGRYTPYEVLGWIVNDWRKDNGIDGINQ